MNAQSPKSISTMIHHSIIAAKIFLPIAAKTVVRTSERKERPPNGKRPPTNANRVKNDKKKDKVTESKGSFEDVTVSKFVSSEDELMVVCQMMLKC